MVVGAGRPQWLTVSVRSNPWLRSEELCRIMSSLRLTISVTVYPEEQHR